MPGAVAHICQTIRGCVLFATEGAKLNEFESIERQAIVMGNPDIEDDVEPVE
jgi:hypothetical protein